MGDWKAEMMREVSKTVEATVRLDALIAEKVAQAKSIGYVSSCSSCTYPACCYQPTLAFLPEALRIVFEHPILVKDRVDELYRLGEESERVDQRVYFDRRVPCPFLGGDGRCEIYACRPEECRSYFVISSSSACDGKAKEGAVVQVLNMDGLKTAWGREMQRTQRRLGLPGPVYAVASLQRMVAIAYEAWMRPTKDLFLQFLSEQSWGSEVWGETWSEMG